MKSYLKLLMVLLLALTLVFACVSCRNNDNDDNGDEGTGENGGETPGGDEGGEQPGGDQPGGDTPGGDQPGGDTPGGDQPGGDQPGGDTPGGDTPGGDTPGGDDGDDDELEIVIPPAIPVEDTYIVDFVYVYQRTYINDFDRMESKRYTERVVRIEIPVENEGLTAAHLEQIAGIVYNGYSFAGWYTGWDDTTGSVSGDLVDFAALTGAITADTVFYADRGNLAGADATWEIVDETDENGKVTATVLKISGTGKMFDFATVDNVDIPWYDSRSSITKVVVDEGITYVGSNAFYGLYAAKALELPSTLEEIGSSSFVGWTKLTALETPANLKKIGQGAFLGATMKTLTLNEGLVEIADSAFNECTKITTIIVPSSLKLIGTGAFHPGSVDGKLAASSIENVYYLGSEADFKKIDIRLDNSWFNELSSVFYTPAENYNPELDEAGAYWYYSESGAPVPMFYQIKYYLNATVYGTKTPIFIDYVRTTATTDESGATKVSATVTDKNVQFMNDIVWHNFKFVEFTNAVSAGLVLEGNKNVTCQVHKGTVNTSAGVNTGYLSNKGGLVWKFNFATETITITNGTTVASIETVTAALAEYLKLADASTLAPEADFAALLGIASAKDMETVSQLGFANAEDFVAFANKLDALELVGPNDPLIATAAILEAAGIATASDLSAFIAEYEAYLADPTSIEETAKAALEAKFAATTLDLVSLKALDAKLAKAGIVGDISDEFAALKATLEALLANEDVNLTELQAKVLLRPTVLAELSAVLNTKFLVGSEDIIGACSTVADLAAAVAKAQSDEGIFKTWDYFDANDTANMWNASNIKRDQTKTIVFDAYVEHIGALAFANLISVTEVVIPSSVKSIDEAAFSGCTVLKSVYYDGAELSEIALMKSGVATGKTLADGALTGATVLPYAKAEAATANEGKYWMMIGDKYVAWNLSGGTLSIGGDSEMVDFAAAEDAPWYPAKASINSVVIERHITRAGENIVNGYEGITSISFSNDLFLKYIPASAFAGTAVLTDKTNSFYWKDGLCIVERYYVLAADSEASYIKVPFRISTIAEGAFDSVEALYELELPSTIQNFHPNVFANVCPTIIYYNGTSADWEVIISNVIIPEDKDIYVALPNRAETDDVTKYYLYQKNKETGKLEIVVGEGADGCIHDYSDWTVTQAPTCLAEGVRERKCNGSCGTVFTEAVPALGHNWSAWGPVDGEPDYEQRICLSENCDGVCKVEGCTEHVAVDGESTVVTGPAHEKRLVNSIFDFEGIEAIDPEMILAPSADSVAIVTDGNGNKVFVFTKSAAEELGFISLRTQSGYLADANLSTYTANVSLGYTSGTAKWQLIFGDIANENGDAAAIIEIIADIYGNLYVGTTSGYGEDAIDTYFVALGKKVGDWFELKLQYYTEGENGEIQVSVDGTVVYSVDNWYGKETGAVAPIAALANALAISPAADQIGTVSLDNIVFTIEKTDKFAAEKNTFDVLTFDEMPATTVVNVPTSAGVTVAPSIITADDGNKYYGFTKGGSGNPGYTFYPLVKSANATAAIFETDMYFPSQEGGSKAFSFNFKAGSTTTYMLEVRLPTTSNTADGSDIVLAVGDKSVSADSESFKSGFYKPQNSVVKNGDWFNLRVEYYNAIPGQNAQTVRMLVYINGELVLYSNNWYGVKQDGTCPAPFSVSDFTNVTISAYGSQKGDWGFDNTKYYHVYAETPTAPVTLKYDNFMENGWNGTMPMPNDDFWTTGTIVDDRAAVVGAAPEIPVEPEKPDVPETPETPDEPVSDIPAGSMTFDDIAAGEWTAPGTGSVLAGTSAQQYAIYGTTVVSADGNVYLSFSKSGRTDESQSSAMAWLVFEKTATVDAGAEIWFQTKMKYATTNGSGTHIRLYSDRTADKATGGTELTTSSTRVKTSALGIAEGEWFTLRIVVSGTTATFCIVAEDGTTTQKATVTNDAMSSITSVQFTCGAADYATFDFDYVYFGAAIAQDAPETPEEPEIPEDSAPAGSATFEGMTEFVAGAVGNVSIGYRVQANADAAATIVTVDGKKYLSVNKAALKEGSNSYQTWLNVCRDASVDLSAGDIYFETKMNVHAWTQTGSGTYFRLYNGRDYAKDGGTKVVDVTMSVKDGFVTIGGTSTGVAPGAWFTLRVVMNATGYDILVLADGADEFVSVQKAEADCSAITCATFMTSSQNLSDFWFEYFYFGAPIVDAPAEDEGAEDEGAEDEDVLPGTIDFESMPAGNYTYNGTVPFTQYIQSAATSETLIVSEDGNKFIRMNKTAGSSSSQTWFVAQRTQQTAAGTTLMFQSDIRLNFTKGSAAYIRFYQGRTADNGNNGTCYPSSTSARNIMLNVSGGKVTLYNASNSANKVVLEAGSNEWFTLRLVLNTNLTIDVYANDADGKMYLAGTLDKTSDWAGLDPTLIDSFVYMNDSATCLCADFDNVYFGAFVPDVESPIAQQPEKEAELPEGTLTFNDIEEAALPEKVTYVSGSSESTFGAVYVTKSNKVLELKTVADSADYFYVNTTARNTLANQYVFATQIFLDSGITAGTMDYTLMPSGAAAADRVFKLRVITDGTKVSVAVVSVVDGVETVGEAVETAAVVGDWFKLSIVYTENAKFDVLVDGAVVATAEAPYGMYKDAAAISQVLVECSAELAGGIYFENMSATQLEVK